MNAPVDTVNLVEPKVELIPVAAIAPSETHIQALRRKRYDVETLKDLAASIARLGVQQPGVVRKLPALRGLAAYELVAGERRWRATRLANVAHFPAIVRELGDAEVLEIQLVENLQRESLHELEEGAGYEELMKVAKLKAHEVGDRLGVSRSQVYSRLNLLKLDGEARAALEDGRLDVSRALVVATVAQPNQRTEALRLALLKGYNDKPVYSVRELRHKIVADKLSMPLKGAPFDMADATLLKDMGECGSCRFRTGNCDPDALDPDVCTNLACFHLKVKAQGERTRAAAEKDGRKVLTGEAARKLSPSVKTVYDHVDLDVVCEADGFPEKAPDLPKEIRDSDDQQAVDNYPPYRAWRDREALWQPRTYRALLEGEKLTPIVIEDPKTKLTRELLPFRQAQALLKKRGIDLPSYYNRKRPTHQARGSKEDQAKSNERREQQQARESAKQETELAVRAGVLKALWPKLKATLDKETLLAIADEASGAEEMLELLFDHSDLRKLKEADLIKVIVYGRIGYAVENFFNQREAKDLYALAGKAKVNVEAIRKEVAKERATTEKADA